MIRSRTFTVKEGGVRLDAALLLHFPTSTRAFVREAVEAGGVLVDGRRAAKGLKLRLAYDKPAGMPVQPLKRSELGTLMNGVVVRHPECIPLGDRPLLAGAVHRIDADTSGLVLVARTAEAFEGLRGQFAAQTVEKTYLALVEGTVAVGGTLENDLVHDPTLPFCREQTLLEVTIFTGVTHQIRAQLAIAGMHIVNDRLYGAFAVENMTGHRLHALAAKFRHPASGEQMDVRTPYPRWAAAFGRR